MSEAIHDHPELVRKYLGTVVPTDDNYFAALNSAVFSDGSFAFIPKGVRCPMELSTYFRINALNTGQFERTLIIAEDRSYVSYLEGCTAPMRDENQLHAAVVELVALDDAEIKYSTVQNWYPGRRERRRRHLQLRHQARRVPRRAQQDFSWTQVETGSAITWKYPSCVLIGDDSTGEFNSVALTHHRQQADTGTKMIHIGKRTKSKIVSKGISAGRGQNTYRGLVKVERTRRGRAQPHPVRQPADRQEVRRAHVPVHRGQAPQRDRRARGHHLEDQRRPAVLLPLARARRGERGVDDRRRLLQAGVPRAADGVRGGGQEAAGSVAGRRGRLTSCSARCQRGSRTRRLDDTNITAGRNPPYGKRIMLKIENLHVRVAGKDILKGLSLDVQPGQVHAIMGPNGAGKSTLGNVLAGREGYEVDRRLGAVRRPRPARARTGRTRRSTACSSRSSTRSRSPGVNNTYFLRAALNAQRKARGEAELDSMQFLKRVREKLAVLHLKDELLNRGVNEGFSGGEKKRNEIFQLAVLEPKLAILDETDSGLDIDALKNVAEGVNALRSPDRAFLLITHYQRLLDYIKPDVVHVLADGRIVESGGPELALELEAHGYAWVKDRIAPGAAA